MADVLVLDGPDDMELLDLEGQLGGDSTIADNWHATRTRQLAAKVSRTLRVAQAEHGLAPPASLVAATRRLEIVEIVEQETRRGAAAQAQLAILEHVAVIACHCLNCPQTNRFNFHGQTLFLIGGFL